MTKEKKTDVKVGITVFIGVSLLLFGILWAKGLHLKPSAQVIKASFTNVGGLETGSPVHVNGVRRGTVSAVDLRNGGVIVTMEMDQAIDLRKDASATITMLELMGGKKVDITPGLRPEQWADGAPLPGLNAGDVGTLVAMVTSLSTTLESITGKADTLFASLNSMLVGDTLKRQLSQTLTSVTRTADQASTLLAQNGPSIRKTFEQSEVLTRELTGTLQENRAGLHTLVDSGGGAIREARVAMGRINLLTMRLDSLLTSSMADNTMLHTLMKDKEFSGRIDSAFNSLYKLTEQMRLQGIDANIRFFNGTKPTK